MTGIHWLTLDAAPLMRMVCLVTALFLMCKVMVYRVWQARKQQTLPARRLGFFFFPWPGMRPELFLNRHAPATLQVRQPAFYLISGLLCLTLARVAGTAGILWLATPLLLAGLSLTVHFGLLGLITSILRSQGYRVRPPFLIPWESTGLNQFWSQRWNRPFTELLAWTVYRPIAKRWGRTPAIWAGFFASGLLHELAISVPVQTGYGLPTLYFLIQAAGVQLEQHWHAPPILKCLAMWLWILLPLPLAFPPAFIHQVLFPLIGLNLQDLPL
jgi:alginate O-acetyltransferase complex protein AlgI